MRTNPSTFKNVNLPVESVSWYDAIEYCNKRSEKEELIPAYTIDKTRPDPTYYVDDEDENEDVREDIWMVTWNRNTNGYRLPTEAEWEYACRAGTTDPFYTGSNITTDQANYNGEHPYNSNTRGIYREKTLEVGNFEPNPWGLYDMHGNVEEWCWDWFGPYSTGNQIDPLGAYSGLTRMIRGGGWHNKGKNLRSARRKFSDPTSKYFSYGFRLVRSTL
jgi:formylglycine-generating enzyme required for sulfatase activity